MVLRSQIWALFAYVIEMSLVPDTEQNYRVYACMCVYTCTHTQTVTHTMWTLLLCLSMSLYWKLLVHTNTCNSRSTPHFHLFPVHTPNSLLWYWRMWFSWYLLYLLIWPPVHDLFQNFPAPLPPHRSIPLPFASNSSEHSPLCAWSECQLNLSKPSVSLPSTPSFGCDTLPC